MDKLSEGVAGAESSKPRCATSYLALRRGFEDSAPATPSGVPWIAGTMVSNSITTQRLAPRRVAIGVLLLALIGPYLWWQWYFGVYPHAAAPSPNGRWVATVTKQMRWFPEPVDVYLHVRHAGASQPVLSVAIDAPDCWCDVQSDAYRIEWINPTEFCVGPARDDRDWWWRATLAGDIWKVGDIEPARANEPEPLRRKRQ